MAGGEGTRLRPMTANQPKPLLPVVNRPIMEHVLRLLKRHGFDETVVTVQFLASLVRTYFGDGDELGMHLSYATEETPLGTAGSVKNAESALRDDSFLVISGDALTDIDLSALVRAHREKQALVTVCLTRVPDPLEFGIVITAEDERIERFLEKPTWGQVFSDTVNTGIYVMEPEVFAHVAGGETVDWSGDVFPALVKAGAPVFGYVAEGYWEDVGTHESYLRAQADVLNRQVDVDIDGFEMAPGVWIGEGAEVDPDAVLKGPLCVGDYAKVEAGAELREFTVLGNNVVVKGGAFLHRAVVHDNVFIGPQANLRGCVIGKNTDIMRAARVEEGAVVGDECVVEEEAYLSSEVKVYPFKTIEAGAVVNTSVIWESRGSSSLFGPRGVSGLVNVEITPEYVVRLASAYATTLKKGSVVTTARDASRAARAFKRGEHVIEYGGLKVPKKEGNRRTDRQWDQGRVYTFELSRRFDLDGSPTWNVARLANQSCDPNCESHNEEGRHVWIVALRPIRKGEEITYDYNFPMTDPPPVCRCGSAKCRGYMVGEDHVAELKAWLKEHRLKGGPGLQVTKRAPPGAKRAAGSR